MKCDKATVKKLQDKLATFAKTLATDGLACRGSRATFDPSSGKISVSLIFNVESEEQERSGFEQGRRVFGLKPEAFGAMLALRGDSFKLVGFDFARKRFPVVTKNAAGKTMLWESKVLDKLPASMRVERDVEVRDFQPRS